MANPANIEVKAKQVEEIREKLEKAQSVVVFDYRGLTVEEVTNLRSEMRKAGVEYVVLKNHIVNRAAPGKRSGRKLPQLSEGTLCFRVRL